MKGERGEGGREGGGGASSSGVRGVVEGYKQKMFWYRLVRLYESTMNSGGITKISLKFKKWSLPR